MESNSEKNQDPMIQSDVSLVDSSDEHVSQPEADESTKIVRPLRDEPPLYVDPGSEENYY